MEAAERPEVGLHAVVRVVPTQTAGEPAVLKGYWRVHPPTSFFPQLTQLAVAEQAGWWTSVQAEWCPSPVT